MRIVDFEQNTKKWNVWRNNGIGASDVPVIMQTNTYKTPLMLWNEKMGFAFEEAENDAMLYGKINEPKAREWLKGHLNAELEPICVEEYENSPFRASLDCWCLKTRLLIEIKCPTSEKTIEKAKDGIFDNDAWYDQIQTQIMITNSKKAFLAIWDNINKCCYLHEIKKDEKRIEQIKEKGNEFWHLVQIGKAPDPLSKDYICIEDEELKDLIEKYKEYDEKEKDNKKKKNEIKKEIIEFGDGGSFIAYDMKATYMPPRVSYDMEKMREDGINIDKYKKTSGVWYYNLRVSNSKLFKY